MNNTSTAEQKTLAIAKSLSLADQLKYVISEKWSDAGKDKHLEYRGVVEAAMRARLPRTKAAGGPVPAISTSNASALYYPSQAPGVLQPATTPPIITALVQLGAPVLPPNTRLLAQEHLLEASEIVEEGFYPAAAPSIDFMLSSRRKFGLILAFANMMLAADNFSGAVLQYVQDQLESAANNATDAFMVSLMTTGGTAANGVAAGMAAFVGDLRTSVWIGNPQTLATLQDAANPNIGPRGGVYKTLPVIASLAAPAGKLFLQDVKRVAVSDGPQVVERSTEASLLMDSDPTTSTSAPRRLFQEDMTALKITKYADAMLLAAPQVITL